MRWSSATSKSSVDTTRLLSTRGSGHDFDHSAVAYDGTRPLRAPYDFTIERNGDTTRFDAESRHEGVDTLIPARLISSVDAYHGAPRAKVRASSAANGARVTP